MIHGISSSSKHASLAVVVWTDCVQNNDSLEQTRARLEECVEHIALHVDHSSTLGAEVLQPVESVDGSLVSILCKNAHDKGSEGDGPDAAHASKN